MKIQKIPLQERLDRLNEYRPAHPEFIPTVIRSFANQHIGAYISGFVGAVAELEKLSELLNIPLERLRCMSYGELAAKIDRLVHAPEPERSRGHKAVQILAAPMEAFFEATHRQRGGVSQ